MAMTFDAARAYAFGLPGVTDATSYGYPSIKAHGKFLTRLSHAHPGTVQSLLLRQWRATAPKKTLKAWDAEHPTTETA